MCGALPPTLEKHIRFTPGDSRSIFLRPAGCIWTPLGALSRTVRPIRFHFPECDFWSVFSRPAGCIWTPSGAILMTRGPYFDTRALHFGSFLELRARPAEPVGHFGSLSGKRCEKGHKWRSNWSSKWHVFRYIFNIFIILLVLLRELGGDWFLGVLFAVFCGSPESGIWIRPQFLLCQTHITYLEAGPDFLIF